MNIIAYYEGDEAVKEWIEAVIEEPITFKKLPTSNDSAEFAKLPAYVADILYLDKPDLILSGNVDGIHEKPIFSIEFASCTPQYQHALQRFSRMMASVAAGCPAALIIPMLKKENKLGGVRSYNRSRAVEYGAVRLMDTHRIPSFVFDWPDIDGVLVNEEGTSLPKMDSPGVVSLKQLLKRALVAFSDYDYIGSLWRLPETRALQERTRERAYGQGAPSIDHPGGGAEGKSRSKLDLMETERFLETMYDELGTKVTNPLLNAIKTELPDFIKSRQQSLIFYPSRITSHAGV